MVQEALKLLRGTVSPNIEFQIRFDPEAPKVAADPTQVHRLIMNLGTNALQAMGKDKGLLRVQVQRVFLDARLVTNSASLPPGEYACLTVADTGPGMDEQVQERIFDPFFTTKSAGHGTGLGLWVVHGILKSHEAGILVHSTPGTGTEFKVFFPAARPKPSTLSAASPAS